MGVYIVRLPVKRSTYYSGRCLRSKLLIIYQYWYFYVYYVLVLKVKLHKMQKKGGGEIE